jgi:hypothetical protein
VKIDIKGQVFEVSPEILQGILDDMGETAKQGVEFGFLMCDTPQGITKGEECTGNACSINLHGCEGQGPVIGNFHSHPEVISFSLGDYITSLHRAKDHPQNKQLMCVALKSDGVRCKAVTSLPPKGFTVPMVDTDENREKVKPFFTKKVSISKEQISELLKGTPWEKLSPENEIIAIDEGDVVVPTDIFAGVGPVASKGGGMPTKGLIEVAQEYINEPTGKYPWKTKTVTKSVKLPNGQIALEMAGMPTLESDESQFIPTRDIEVPDPGMIAYGEVAGYISALSPIILTKEKNEAGKFKILDGRHRVAAWRASGYKQIPVVFTLEKEYKPA